MSEHDNRKDGEFKSRNEITGSTTSDESETDEIGWFSRRAALASVAGAGLLSIGSQTVSAGSGDHLGESWSGDPSSNYGLRIIAEGDTTFGYMGFSKASDGRGVLGRALSSTGTTVGVLGRSDSGDDGAVGVQGFCDAPSGRTYGFKGRSDSPRGRGALANATASTGNNFGMIGRSASPSGVGVLGQNTAGSGTTYGLQGRVGSPSGYGVYTPDDAKVDGTMEVGGDVQVSGVKNFVQTVSTDSGPKQIKYTSIESGDPQTETSDVAEMTNEVAVVDLPDHFGMVTSSEEPLSVQVTPYCNEKVHPQVTDQSTERIVVKDFSDGPTDYTFAYTVKGIRQGFEDQEVVSENW